MVICLVQGANDLHGPADATTFQIIFCFIEIWNPDWVTLFGVALPKFSCKRDNKWVCLCVPVYSYVLIWSICSSLNIEPLNLQNSLLLTTTPPYLRIQCVFSVVPAFMCWRFKLQRLFCVSHALMHVRFLSQFDHHRSRDMDWQRRPFLLSIVSRQADDDTQLKTQLTVSDNIVVHVAWPL